MGWLVAALGRVAFIAVWIATPLVGRAFDGNWLFPLIGALLLPFTALAYVLAYVPGAGVTGWAWAWVALGVLVDFAAHSSGAYSSRRRLAGRHA